MFFILSRKWHCAGLEEVLSSTCLPRIKVRTGESRRLETGRCTDTMRSKVLPRFSSSSDLVLCRSVTA